jgi:DNA-binding transcriptional regulator YhcF (GntR family)
MAQQAIPGVDLELERNSDVPLGTQLAWKLRAAIVAGRLEPGHRLPGVRELAAAAGVNVNTVRSVYARLAEQGIVASEHGRGTFVAGNPAAAAGELVELAEQTARDALRRGVDPRELAAVLYAGARAEAPQPDRGTAADGEAGARRRLRDEIARFEREAAELEWELTSLGQAPRPAAPPDAEPRRPAAGARLMSADELAAVRDQVVERAAAMRERLAAAREAELARPERARSTAARAPQTVIEGGTWTLRWKA